MIKRRGRCAIGPEEGADRATTFTADDGREGRREVVRELQLGHGFSMQANGGDRTRCLRPGQPALFRLSYVRGDGCARQGSNLRPSVLEAGNSSNSRLIRWSHDIAHLATHAPDVRAAKTLWRSRFSVGGSGGAGRLLFFDSMPFNPHRPYHPRAPSPPPKRAPGTHGRTAGPPRWCARRRGARAGCRPASQSPGWPSPGARPLRIHHRTRKRTYDDLARHHLFGHNVFAPLPRCVPTQFNPPPES